MPFLFIYLLKLSVSLAVVFLFYQFVLRKLTFYNWNRWYLLGYSLLSFFIPFIDISIVLQRNEWSENSIVQWVPVIHNPATETGESHISTSFSAWNFISLLVITGMFIMLFRLLIQFISFRRLMKKAQFISGEGMKLYQVDENIIPFSFGNSIFINRHLHTETELQEIIRHEFVHVKQRHSLDILCGELLCLLNWYNPFAWMLRRSIRQNLEFIADNKVLENGISRKEYQYLLLKVIGNNHFSIAPKFNFSSLKKRIAMMNKMKSAGVHLVKFLFILPLVAVLLVAFRNQYEKQQHQAPGINRNVQDTIPLTERRIQKMPEEISSISVMSGNNDATVASPIKEKISGMVVVKRKDGGKETYDLNNKESMDAFEKKYGVKLEDILPPPPPAPPVDGTPAIPPTPPVPPVPPLGEAVTGLGDFLERNPDVKNVGFVFNSDNTVRKINLIKKDGTNEEIDLQREAERKKGEDKYGKFPVPLTTIPAAVVPGKSTTSITPFAAGHNDGINLNGVSSEYEITDKKAMIKLKDGTVENYDLTSKKDCAAFEKKYGKIINVATTINSNVNTDVKASVNSNVNTTIKANVNANIKADVKANVNTNVDATIRATVTPEALNPNLITTAASPKASRGSNSITSVTPVAMSAGLNQTLASTAPRPASLVTIVDEYGYVITGKEDIIITITKKTTRQELDKFITQMKEKGVDLDFDEIEYNDKGILVSINGTMKSGDSRSNFVATDFSKLILAMIKKGDKTYFKVSTIDSKEVI
jgi:hypothetical protein